MIGHRLRLPTPDHVELEFELAGIASRFAAFLIDSVLIMAVVGLLWVAGLLSWGALMKMSTGVGWAIGLLILVSFLFSWGYFVFSETLFRGRTLGKAAMGLRVLRDDGVPVGLRAAAIRNLVRLADLIPPPFGLLGGVVAIVSPLGKRLGDMAAGTIVVRERFAAKVETDSSALWMERLEKGASRQAVLLPGGQVTVEELALVERFLRRRSALPTRKRRQLAWEIARPLLRLMDEDPLVWEKRFDREIRCEEVLEKVVELAREAANATTPSPQESALFSAKHQHWAEFDQIVTHLLQRGNRALRALGPEALTGLLDSYRRITADLARARSLGADALTIERVNRLAVLGHNLIYGHAASESAPRVGWLSAFAKVVRRHPLPLLVSALLLLAPALAGYLAVQLNPELGYELVPPAFLDFSPAREESLHDIPPLARPLAASAILTNNIQVSLAAFSLGLTAGIGTVMVMINNGLHIGAVAGWMTRSGQERALWGWIMPHGGTELLAIIIAGMAGCLLAGAIISPGRLSRREALKQCAGDALILEVGCMAMLVVAGVIEGFVSPSQIGYAARIAVLVISLAFWVVYFALAGRGWLTNHE